MKMSKRILIAMGGVLLVLVGLGTVKGLQIGRMIEQGESFEVPPQTVTTATVEAMKWDKTLSAVGSLEAVQGMIVTAELPGKVTKIPFQAGTWVESGQLLLQQDVTEERARLRSAESSARLALRNFNRAKSLNNEQVVTESVLDDARAVHEQAVAEVERIRAVIAKKTIRAPFSGRLGIRKVDLGEVLDSGQPIVSLQSMDPIFANFQLPQQNIDLLETGLGVRVYKTSERDAFVNGQVTALNPDVNPDTRNIHVQATLANADEQLRPGMFVRIDLRLPERSQVVTIPATAVLHAPYSDSVFVVEAPAEKKEQGPSLLRQQFVQLGEKRGDYVAVLTGLQPGDTVVSTGVFKLRNGIPVVVDNRLSPEFKLNPVPDNA